MLTNLMRGEPKENQPAPNANVHMPNYAKLDHEANSMEGFERQGTAEVVNDPRFYTENVIDKRLAAFEALAIVTELLAAEAVKQCFELPADFKIVGPCYHVLIMQIIGFSIMILVLYMATVATAVLSLQLFFAIRLMTAGPTGFDKSASFYTDKRMWLYREKAVFGVKYSIVGFFLSTGFMLYVKIWTEGVSKEEIEKEEEIGRFWHKLFACVTLFVFVCLTVKLFSLVKTHNRCFEDCYSSVDTCQPGEITKHLSSRADAISTTC